MAFDFWANFQYYSLGELVWMRNKASKASKVSYVRPLKDFLQGDRSIVLSCGRWGRARNGCALHLTQTVLCFLTEASAAHGDGIDLLSSTRAQTAYTEPGEEWWNCQPMGHQWSKVTLQLHRHWRLWRWPEGPMPQPTLRVREVCYYHQRVCQRVATTGDAPTHYQNGSVFWGEKLVSCRW